MSTTLFHGMRTGSRAMRAFFEQLRRVSRTESTVLIRGETGTGKELVAQAVHQLSPRHAAPFRALNCATLTADHLASELFGHVRGAYTGADRAREGLFSLADRGTLFLDEVAEIPLAIQARLLRVLQERTFVPLGGSTPLRVDVRLLAATHRALRREVARGRFREDLMYRIRVVPIFLPPLRERGDDIALLARHFLQSFNDRGGRQVTRLHPATLALLRAYPWPGNIRELRNVIEYAFAVGEGPVLTVDELTPELRGEGPPEARARPSAQPTEADRIRAALAAAGGRKGAAAARLGISRSTLWRRMRELGMAPER